MELGVLDADEAGRRVGVHELVCVHADDGRRGNGAVSVEAESVTWRRRACDANLGGGLAALGAL